MRAFEAVVSGMGGILLDMSILFIEPRFYRILLILFIFNSKLFWLSPDFGTVSIGFLIVHMEFRVPQVFERQLINKQRRCAFYTTPLEL